MWSVRIRLQLPALTIPRAFASVHRSAHHSFVISFLAPPDPCALQIAKASNDDGCDENHDENSSVTKRLFPGKSFELASAVSYNSLRLDESRTRQAMFAIDHKTKIGELLMYVVDMSRLSYR